MDGVGEAGEVRAPDSGPSRFASPGGQLLPPAATDSDDGVGPAALALLGGGAGDRNPAAGATAVQLAATGRTPPAATSSLEEIEEVDLVQETAAAHQPLLGSKGFRAPSSSQAATPSPLFASGAAHTSGGYPAAQPGSSGHGTAPQKAALELDSASKAEGIAISAAALATGQAWGGGRAAGGRPGSGNQGAMARLEVEAGEAGDGYGYPSSSGPMGALRRFILWVLSFAIPGMGMFSEAYFVFSIGNLKGIFTEAYPECWQEHLTCSQDLVHTLTWSQVSGIILGQLGIGFFADRLGRKWGSVMTAAFMLVFGVLVAASTGRDSGDLFLMFTICQALFGVGVGGEYPVASTSANERAEQTRHLQRRRGETVILTFSMQGWGNAANTLVLLALMAAFGQRQAPYDRGSLAAVWRLSYVVGLLPIAFMFVWRVWFLKESEVWRRGRQSAAQLGRAGPSPSRKQWLLLRHYWHRVFGTSLSWFVWDFAFYGNKLFQSTFISVISPGAGLFEVLQWTLLNSGVALVGYYVAAFTVDTPWLGRKRMQANGFLWMFLLFLLCAAFYDSLVSSHIRWFQFLYFFSSFWGQFGPNATTWLLPAELVPTEMRSMCHGLASAVGKAGALAAGVVFGLVSERVKFWISAWCGLAGVFLTLALIPDITSLDLREGDERWQAILDGSAGHYSGEAVNPRHLSYVERLLGYGETYCPSDGATGTAEEDGQS